MKELGRFDSATRTPEQTTQALFWTDHDIRQWNDGMLRLVTHRGLDLVQAARLLAIAHVSGGDGMIACFDAKYYHWFWRPYRAIPLADTDGNPDTQPDPTWVPLGNRKSLRDSSSSMARQPQPRRRTYWLNFTRFGAAPPEWLHVGSYWSN